MGVLERSPVTWAGREARWKRRQVSISRRLTRRPAWARVLLWGAQSGVGAQPAQAHMPHDSHSKMLRGREKALGMKRDPLHLVAMA